MRHFIIDVQEGAYSRQIAVSVSAEAIEMLGDEAIKSVAQKEWRRLFGPSLPMATFSMTVTGEIHFID